MLRLCCRNAPRANAPIERAAKCRQDQANSQRSAKALHPTNLHVNQALYPQDTVQSRLPDPQWLERWLDGQIAFDREWESRVVRMILRNLSQLFERQLRSVQELNRYRKALAVRAAPSGTVA